MTHQRVVYAELNLGRNPKRQQRTSDLTSSPLSGTGQEVTYVELNLHGASRECSGNDKDQPRKHCPSRLEKVVAGVLGTLCLILMIIVVVMVTDVIPSTKIQQKNNSSLLRTQKETHNLSSANCCPKEWLTYSNSCYYISVDRKTWNDSLSSCWSKNSTLLYINDEEELEFLGSLSLFSWIGILRTNRDNSWKLINGSEFKLHHKIIKSSSTTHKCVTLSPSGLMPDSCDSLKTFQCKRELQNSYT